MTELTVHHLGARGDGVALEGGRNLYLPFGAPGDRFRLAADGTPELVAAGDNRQAPPCRHFGTCGGCRVQHLKSDLYRDWKRDLIRLPLERAGVEIPTMAPTAESPPGSRRRARFAARRLAKGTVLGFNEARSRQIVPLAVCPVLRPDLQALLPALRDLCDDLLRPGQTLDLQLTASDEGMDLVLYGLRDPDLEQRERLGAWMAEQDVARLSASPDDRRAPEILLARRDPVLRWADGAVVPPPGGFLQATREGERTLQDVVARHLAGVRAVVDLYAGCGTLSLAARRHGRVHAVDSHGEGLAALDRAARRQEGRPLTVEQRDLARRPLRPEELKAFEAAIVDPPRAGARTQADMLAQSPLQRIVMVSCNPTTFARDAALLTGGGFRMTALQPVDQFLWSAHMELAALFQR